MPPVAKKDVAVVVFDVDRSDKDFYEESLKFLFDISSREWFFSPKNSVKLLLLNAEESKNCLNKSNIFEVTEHFIQFNPNIIKENVKGSKYVKNKASWIDGLSVGLSLLSKEIDMLDGIVSSQLVLISKNYSNVTPTYMEDLNAAVKIQNKYMIKTIITGSSVSVGFIRDINELRVWAKYPIVLDSISEESKHALEMICKDSETLVCDLNMGRDLFCVFRTKTKMFPWKASLSFGTSLEIPLFMYRILKGEGAVSAQLPSNMDRNSFTWVYVEDETKEVAHDDVVHGVFRWDKFVAFEKNLNRYFKVEGPKNFTLRGFTDKINVPETIFLEDGTSTLAPDPKDPHSYELLYLLYKCLLETDKVGIASKTYARNCHPRMVALIPDEKRQTILVNELPYADDVICNWTEKNPENNAEIRDEKQTEEEKEVFEFVNNLRVPLYDFNLGTELSFNPRSALVARKIAEKYLGMYDNDDVNLKLPSWKGSAFESRFPVVNEREVGENEININNESGEEIDEDYLL